jgi:tRNA1(Val) A37 N6-methylase TrmN6
MSLDHTADLVKQQSLTSDAFLDGRLIVAQPAAGFRAGLDSVLLGAAVNGGSLTLLDLGAGAGTAALVALVHHDRRTATLAEFDPGMLALAAANLAANGFAPRGRALQLDVTAAGAVRAAAGLPRDHYTTVIANPPYFSTGSGTPPSGARAAARHMAAESLDRWVRTAVASAAPGGEVIFVNPAESLPRLIAAFERRLGAMTILPLVPREGEPATRILVRGIKGSRAPLSLLASRALHESRGRGFLPAFDAIFRGLARLDW